MCGQRDGEQAAARSCSLWAPPGPASGLCLHRMLVPELMLALGSVGRGTWHAHTLMPLMKALPSMFLS